MRGRKHGGALATTTAAPAGNEALLPRLAEVQAADNVRQLRRVLQVPTLASALPLPQRTP